MEAILCEKQLKPKPPPKPVRISLPLWWNNETSISRSVSKSTKNLQLSGCQNGHFMHTFLTAAQGVYCSNSKRIKSWFDYEHLVGVDGMREKRNHENKGSAKVNNNDNRNKHEDENRHWLCSLATNPMLSNPPFTL